MSPAQKRMLEIFDFFKGFCGQNNLRYVAIGGTALGLVRHKGFIPWDDDMDFGMPVNDYFRFVEIIKKSKLKNRYRFIEIPGMGGKIVDTSTTFLEAPCVEHDDNFYGVFIDIFPLVGIPKSKPERSKFLDEVRKFNETAILWYHYRSEVDISRRELFSWRKDLMSRYPLDAEGEMIEFPINYWFICKAGGIQKGAIKAMSFEGVEMAISGNYEDDLRAHYGNFMEMPPKEKRVKHDEFGIIDLEHDPSHYKKLIDKFNKASYDLLRKKHRYEGYLTRELHKALEQNRVLDERVAWLEKTCADLKIERDKTQEQIEKIWKSRTFRALEKIRRPVVRLRGIVRKKEA